jgi:hypothetical protein
MIPFTQYIRPCGRKEKTGVERPFDIEAMANQFISEGGKFECELLRTNLVSLTASFVFDGEARNIACVLSSNNSELLSSVDLLVQNAYDFILGGKNDKP